MSARVRLFLLPVTLLALLTLPSVLTVGMSFDGVMNASIARNLAEGMGTFWAPHYTETVHARYFEFFPLGLWLESWAYRLFGDHLVLDRLWALATGVAILGLIVPLWRLTQEPAAPSAGAWWPAILFLSCPLVVRTLSQNDLESTMTVFVLGATAMALLALRHERVAWQVAYGAAAGVLCIVAMLAKSPQGLFPLVVPVLAPLFLPGIGWRAAAVVGLAMAVAAAAVLGSVLVGDPTAREALHAVTTQRILMSLEGRRELSLSRWYFLERLLKDLAVPVGIGIVGALLLRRPIRVTGAARAGFFIALGCAGSLPFLLSPIQFTRYLFPSLPFFAGGIGALFDAPAAHVERAVASWRAWRLGVTALACAGLATAVGVMVGRAGTITRDVEFHRDLTLQNLALERRPVVSVCPARLVADWRLVANMQRVYGASLTATGDARLRLVESDADCGLPAACVRLQAGPPRRYALYRCPAGPI
jgi:hypothetical protein